MQIPFLENRSAGVLAAILMLSGALLTGCGMTITEEPTAVVEITPPATTLYGGQTVQLATTVTNVSNKAVIWSIKPTSTSTITPSGLFTAPANITTAQTVTVTATSQADAIASSSASITLEPTAIVTVTPPTATLYGSQTVQLAATVANASNTSVTWSVSPAGTGSISPSGLYTAPAIIAAAQTVTITATSEAEATSYSSATVTLEPAAVVSVTPPTATLYGGQTVQLAASVTNASKTGVTWSVSQTGEGSVSPSGLYTAPASITAAQIVTITATSEAEATSHSSATVTLEPAAMVSVTPPTATLYRGQSMQLAAFVTNASNTAVTWSVSPAGTGFVSPSGLYTAPASITAAQIVTITATSEAEATSYSSATVTLEPAAVVSVTPPTATLYGGQTLQLAASVTNASNTGGQTTQGAAANAPNASVIWSALVGTVKSDGLYTAPSNLGSSDVTDTITATSVQDPTQFATATVTVSSNLVGWWPLNEGTGLVANDISGQGNNGAWSGVPSSSSHTYYGAGQMGSSAGLFDGSDTSVIVATRATYGFTGPFTLSAWVNTVSSGTILSMQNDGRNGYNLALQYGGLRFCIYSTSTEQCVAGGSYPLTIANWVYVTAVFDGSHIYVYSNGDLLASGSASPPTKSTGPLAFGIAQRGGYSNFAGSLDDVRIYNRALSSNEITSLYNINVGIPNAPINLQALPGNAQVGLSWGILAQGVQVTDYGVSYRESGTSVWTAFSHSPSVANVQVVTGLNNGASYDFIVMAVNSVGVGLPSGVVTATPEATSSSITVSITPSISSVSSGANISFAANVANALSASVTWSAFLGTVTPDGLYTAPSNLGSSNVTDTITVTSLQDATKSASATVTVSSGLVGWWPLNEGTGLVAIDVSGQGNNGAWSGVPSSSSHTHYTAGRVDSYAGLFDGSDTSVTVGTQPVYRFTGPFTVSAWINTLSTGTIASMQNNGVNGYNLALQYGGLRFCVYSTSTEQCVVGGSYPLNTPAWTHVAAVFDGAKLYIYANGVLLASGGGVIPSLSTGPLVFGAAQRGGYSDFSGSINDVRIYNRALSTNDISSLYNVDVGVPNGATNLKAFPGNAQVALSWDAPSQGAIVTDYAVSYRQSGASTWILFPHAPSVVNAQVVTGLTNGTSYDFQMTPVSLIGDGAASNIVTTSPASGDWSVIASDDDEFVGPFSSWLNVKTDFGAAGDGVTDDTTAFQSALNELESASSHANILYIPAGTYKITSSLTYVSPNCSTYCLGKSIIGENPLNTILRWNGHTTGSAMFIMDGIYRMQFNRMTLDGSGAQITLVNETMHNGCCYDGSNEFSDDIFENAAIGIQAGDNSVGCCSAETKVDRDTFAHFTEAGISLEDANALDWYVRYSTFAQNKYGVTNIYGAGGAIHLDHNLFEYNAVDSGWGNGSSQSYTYNTSYHSGTFLEGGPFGNSSMLIGNTVLVPQHAAITMPNLGPLTLINNTIEGTITAVQSNNQTVTLANGSASSPNSFVVSMGNTYVSANPFLIQNVLYGTNQVHGGLTSIDDTVVSIADVHVAPPLMPQALPNYHRTIYDVPQGASGATIQSTIDMAIAQNNGTRPVVHIPWGQYSVSSTITIPGNSDVQIVGDSMQTIIHWTGPASSPVFLLLPPSHATIRNLQISAGSATAGILVEGYDRPGDRIYTNFVANGVPGSSHNLLVNGFDNTFVQMDDFGHGEFVGSAGPSVLVLGGPLSQRGDATPGFTGLFMGSSCCSTAPSYRVDQGGTIVLTGFWYEQGGNAWLNLDGASGTFIAYEDVIAVDSWATLKAAVPSITANNFNGTLIIANSNIQNGYVNLAGSTSANVLMLSDSFDALTSPPVIANTNNNASTQAATINPVWGLNGVSYAFPDEVSPGTSRNDLLQSSLVKLAGYKDPAITTLPSTNEDVRLIDIVVNNGVSSFDFHSVAAGTSAAVTAFLSGSNTHSASPTLFSGPSSPWCKWIEVHSFPTENLKANSCGGAQ